MSGHISAFPHAWDNKFRDIPRFPATPIIGRYDGDLAELDEMIDRIIEAGPARLRPLPLNQIYRDTIEALGFAPHRLPRIVDNGAAQLAQWYDHICRHYQAASA